MSGERTAGIVERAEASLPGRIVITLFVLVLGVCVLVTNLPANSSLRNSLIPRTQPVLNALGLDQNWGVFAPDPRQEVVGLDFRMTYPDGSTEVWKPTERNDVVGEYSDYRWQKLMENLLADGGGDFARDTALWVAREKRLREEVPQRITVVSRRAKLPPPGPKASEPLSFEERTDLDIPLNAKKLKEAG